VQDCCFHGKAIASMIFTNLTHLPTNFPFLHYTVSLPTTHLPLQGSTKTAILGEAFLNLTTYLSSSDSTDISLPLKKSNSGTVLQVYFSYLYLLYSREFLMVYFIPHDLLFHNGFGPSSCVQVDIF
jgi:hypothetical protein